MVLTAHSKYAQQALVTFCRPTKEWADFIYGERLTDRDRGTDKQINTERHRERETETERQR